MKNPRDFIPAKYKKNQTSNSVDSRVDQPTTSHVDLDDAKEVNNEENSLDINKTSSPWSDLAKEPEVPEYRNELSTKENTTQTKTDIVPTAETTKPEPQIPLPTQATQKKSKSSKNLIGLLVVFFLVVGVFASYMLSQQNQDNRQQASESCEPDDPYCVCAYYDSSGVTCRIDYEKECVSGFHLVGGHCIPTQCQDRDGNGKYVCGYGGDTDPCTENSMGRDWCIDQSGMSISCEELGMIRCKCSDGGGSGYWVIGTGNSCDGLCSEAGVDCPECNTPDEPNNPPGDPTPTPTPTPTPVPEPLICGETGCNQNADCQDGLTCQAITINNQSTGICAKGENQLFCAADPTTDNCCVSQAMPVCASIDMLDANNNLMTEDDDDNLTTGDEVRFRCTAEGNQDVDFDYEFRIWDKSTDQWTDITDDSGTVAKNVSDSYVLNNFSKYVVQGRICWASECQVWETVDGAP